MGRLLACSSLGAMGWQWLEEATALPRVGLLDGPDCRSKAVQGLCSDAIVSSQLSSMMMYKHGLAIMQ